MSREKRQGYCVPRTYGKPRYHHSSWCCDNQRHLTLHASILLVSYLVPSVLFWIWDISLPYLVFIFTYVSLPLTAGCTSLEAFMSMVLKCDKSFRQQCLHNSAKNKEWEPTNRFWYCLLHIWTFASVFYKIWEGTIYIIQLFYNNTKSLLFFCKKKK